MRSASSEAEKMKQMTRKSNHCGLSSSALLRARYSGIPIEREISSSPNSVWHLFSAKSALLPARRGELFMNAAPLALNRYSGLGTHLSPQLCCASPLPPRINAY